jgi:hypothetical protein
VYSKDEEVEKLFHYSFPFTQDGTRQTDRQTDRQTKCIIHAFCLLYVFRSGQIAALNLHRDAHSHDADICTRYTPFVVTHYGPDGPVIEFR